RLPAAKQAGFAHSDRPPVAISGLRSDLRLLPHLGPSASSPLPTRQPAVPAPAACSIARLREDQQPRLPLAAAALCYARSPGPCLPIGIAGPLQGSRPDTQRSAS